MNKAYSRINWENYPSTDTPLNETNLNRMDLAVDTIDDRVITLGTTKANESDLLTCVASISFNSTTGIMTITLKNGTTGTIDTGLSKLAINFDYDDDPTSPHYQQIIMEMKDGTYKYIDLSALLTQYEFTNSSTIAWTIGNDGTVSASVVDGSITAAKLQPNYLADIIVEVGKAQTAATNANADSLEAEGFAVGEQNGVPVTSESPYYHNNAKYYAQQSGGQALSALTDVQLSSPTNGQALIYDANSDKWVNGEGGMVLVAVPVPKSKSYTYNGQEQTFEWDSIDSDHVALSGNKQTNAGNYTVTANLKGVNDAWINADGTVSREPKTFTWNIAKATGDFTLSTNSVSALMPDADPTVNVTDKVGDGTISVSSSAVGVVNPSYSANVITLTKVSAGTATVTVSLSETTNYTAQTKTIAVTFTKANQTFNLSASSVELTTATPTRAVIISGITGDGAFSVSSSNTGVATASVSGNVVSITSVASGSATITVTKAATTNYNALSKTINVAVSLNITVTLTINGAKEDNITIKDSSNVTKGTCVFASGQTSGTCQISIPPNGGSYTFISSVAKSLDGLGNNYTKSVTLTSSPTQTVNVYDSNALEWIGNKIKPFETKAVMVRTSYDSVSHPKAPIIQLSTNATAVTGVSDAITSTGGIYACTEQINFANYSKLKIEVISSTYGYLQNYRDVSIKCVSQITTSSASGVLAVKYIAVTSNQQPPFPYAHTGIIEVDLSNISQTGFVVIDVYRDSGVATDPQPSITYSRIWLEP